MKIYYTYKYDLETNSIDKVNEILIKQYSQNVYAYKTHLGKPMCNDNLSIGITHSKNLMIISISEYNVAIDVEYYRKLDESVVNMFSNQKDVKIKPIILWTIKEAYLKYIGVGLYLDPRNVIVSNQDVSFGDDICKYIISNYFEGAVLSIVSKEREEPIEFINLDGGNNNGYKN